MGVSTEGNTLPNQSISIDSLRIRQETYERYSVPKVDYHDWVLDRIHWRGDERVLDVGCGPGDYCARVRSRWPDVHYYGMDYAAQMLRGHPAPETLAQADAQRLPYPDHSFDVVMANHMLFQVADRVLAISEFRRVLKPDGLLLAATNSQHTLPELQALMRRALVLLGVSGKQQTQPPPFPHEAFCLENGTKQLAQQFYAVVRYDIPSSLVFPSLDPAMDFLDSTREMREGSLPPGVTWDDLMMVMREQIAALLTHFGEFVVNKLSGALVASDRGGFIHDFVGRQNGHMSDTGRSSRR